MTASLPRLHAITDDRIARLPDLEPRARALARVAGIALHARLPGRPGGELLALARRFQALGAVVFVNDRADIARILGVHVHLPALGLPIADAKALLTGSGWVGRSVHSPDEAKAAHDQGADFVLLGPIWASATHPERPPLGIEAIAAAAPARVLAIGGITPERVAACCEAGAYGVAAIRALWEAHDPGSAARDMMLSLERCVR